MYELNGFTEEYQDTMEKLFLRGGFAVSYSESGNLRIEPLNGTEDEKLLAKLREYDLI